MKPFLLLALACAVAAPVSAQPLTRAQAEATRTRLASEILAKLKTERAPEIESRSITLGDKTLKWLEKDFGKAPRAAAASGSPCTAAAAAPPR